MNSTSHRPAYKLNKHMFVPLQNDVISILHNHVQLNLVEAKTISSSFADARRTSELKSAAQKSPEMQTNP